VAGALAAATAVATVALLAVIFRSDTAAVSRRIVVGVAPAFLLASVLVVVRLPFGLHLAEAMPSPYVACLAAAVGLIAYALISAIAWPRVAGPFIRLATHRPRAAGDRMSRVS
jgi:hypothetical protein